MSEIHFAAFAVIAVFLVAIAVLLRRPGVSLETAVKRFPCAVEPLSRIRCKRIGLRVLRRDDLAECEWTRFHHNFNGCGPEHDVERQCIVLIFEDDEYTTLSKRKSVNDLQLESMLSLSDRTDDSISLGRAMVSDEVAALGRVKLVLVYKTFDPFYSVEQHLAWSRAELLELPPLEELEDWLQDSSAAVKMDPSGLSMNGA